jgi:hypothetical protein
MSRVPNKIKIGSEVFWMFKLGSMSIIFTGIVYRIYEKVNDGRVAQMHNAQIFSIEAPAGIPTEYLRQFLTDKQNVDYEDLKSMEDIKWQKK